MRENLKMGVKIDGHKVYPTESRDRRERRSYSEDSRDHRESRDSRGADFLTKLKKESILSIEDPIRKYPP